MIGFHEKFTLRNMFVENTNPKSGGEENKESLKAVKEFIVNPKAPDDLYTFLGLERGKYRIQAHEVPRLIGQNVGILQEFQLEKKISDIDDSEFDESEIKKNYKVVENARLLLMPEYWILTTVVNGDGVMYIEGVYGQAGMAGVGTLPVAQERASKLLVKVGSKLTEVPYKVLVNEAGIRGGGKGGVNLQLIGRSLVAKRGNLKAEGFHSVRDNENRGVLLFNNGKLGEGQNEGINMLVKMFSGIYEDENFFVPVPKASDSLQTTLDKITKQFNAKLGR